MPAPLSAEITAHIRKIRRCVELADYKKALDCAEIALQKFPDVFEIQYLRVTVMGDYGALLKGPRKKRLRDKTLALMRALLAKRKSRQGGICFFYLKNEYYWHTRQRLKQYENGKALAKKSWTGHYGQGVGAAWHASELAGCDQWKRARRWASVSIAAWRRYFKRRDTYYNCYVHLALAEGVLGRFDRMEMSLKRSAQLAKRPYDYAEFREIRETVKRLHANRKAWRVTATTKTRKSQAKPLNVKSR